MSDTVRKSSSGSGRADKIDERASEFVLRRYDLEGWSDADETQLEAWLDESLSHRTAYWRLKAVWTRANRLDALRPMSPPGGPSGGQRSTLFRFKLAAAIAFVALLGGSAWFLSPPAMQTFATAVGERRNLKLPDGSSIELTTNTVIRMATGGNQRSVWLDKGEAYFDIVHDANRLFVLHSTKFRIVDLGTEFSVRRDDNRIEVTVAKGSVRVEAADPQVQQDAVTLLPGQAAVADKRSISVSRKSATQIADTLSWRQGILVFRHTPLGKVAAEFNRYNRARIHIDDPNVSRMTISARLPATDVNVFARMAQDFLGLKVKRTGDEIRLSSRGT